MAITGGKYLVGENGDYADLSAALNDIDTNVYTDLEFVVISPFTDSGMAATKAINFGNPNLELKITSPVDPKGKPIVSFPISLTGTRAGGFFPLQITGTRGGIIQLEHLHVKHINQPSSAGYMFVITSQADHINRNLEVHNCIFDGGGYSNTNGISAGGNILHKFWNNVFREMPNSSSYGILFDGSAAGFEFSAMDNSIFDNVYRGVRYEYGVYTNNCIGVNCPNNPFADAYGLTDLKSQSRGNVIDYITLTWNGPGNKIDPDLADQFISFDPSNKDFMVPVDGSYLYVYGAMPKCDLNTTSVEGQARPGSSFAVASGIVDRREKLREHWNSTRKFTIDGSKIKVSTSAIQFCLTQVAEGMTDVMKAAKADGGDLRITTDRWGWEELPIEVAQWDPATEKCMIWFKPASVVAGEDYDFYLWFGNEDAAQVPLNHDKGQWAVWENYNLVLHCLEDPVNDGYVKDSSSHMAYGAFEAAASNTWQDGLPDGGAIGKSYLFRTVAENTIVRLPAGDYINGDGYIQVSTFVEPNSSSFGNSLEFSQNTNPAAPRFYHRLTSGRQTSMYVRTPDGGTAVSPTGSVAVGLNTVARVAGRLLLGASPEKARHYTDGQFTDEDDISGVGGAFSNTDSLSATFGGDYTPNSPFRGKLQEMWLHNVDREDGFQETFYENLENGSDFFKTPSAVNQRGCRDILFSTEEGEIHLSATDFYITYDPALYGGVVMTLNAVWEAIGLDQDWGLPRREAIETELRHLAKMIGKYGTLTIGPDYEHEYDKMTLSGVSVEVADNNTAIVYSLSFNPEESFLVSRSIVFDGQRIDAQEFFVAYTRDDRTVFKEVFRAAPLRIESGPNLTRVLVTGLIAITGDAESALAVRQRTEAFLKEWSTIRQGTEGTLEIDGVEVGTAHLSSVAPSDLSIPGRLALTMEFATDYGS